MMLCAIIGLSLLLLSPLLAWGSAVVCAVTATPAKVSRFHPSSDPSRFVPGATETCSWIVGDAATAQQIDLWHTVKFQYLKVVANATIGGEVQPQSLAEMDAAEKQTVDTLLAEKKSRQDAWNAELATADVCKFATVADVDAKMQQAANNIIGLIDGMTLVAADKTKLKQVLQVVVTGIAQVTKCDVARASGG